LTKVSVGIWRARTVTFFNNSGEEQTVQRIDAPELTMLRSAMDSSQSELGAL